MTTSQINDAEATHPQANGTGDVDPLIVRSAMREHVAHCRDLTDVNDRRRIPIQDAGYATHMSQAPMSICTSTLTVSGICGGGRDATIASLFDNV